MKGVRVDRSPQYIHDRVTKVESGCWNWRLYTRDDGYAVVTVQGSRAYAHRVSYEIFHGAIPDGFQIDHLCRNRSCVNPDHLEAVTPGVNIQRAVPYAKPGSRGRKVGWRKKVCKRGHVLTEENTERYWSAKGNAYYRRCIPCKRIRLARVR